MHPLTLLQRHDVGGRTAGRTRARWSYRQADLGFSSTTLFDGDGCGAPPAHPSPRSSPRDWRLTRCQPVLQCRFGEETQWECILRVVRINRTSKPRSCLSCALVLLPRHHPDRLAVVALNNDILPFHPNLTASALLSGLAIILGSTRPRKTPHAYWQG
jgi:hypothetical protein